MTMERLGEALLNRREPVIDDVDIRYFIEKYYRDVGKLIGVKCLNVSHEVVEIRDKSASERQAIYLLERDLRRVLVSEMNFTFDILKITQW